MLCSARWAAKPDDKSVYYFVGIDEARFKRPVVPGDQLSLEVRIDRATARHLEVRAATRASAARSVAEATILCTVRGRR